MFQTAIHSSAPLQHQGSKGETTIDTVKAAIVRQLQNTSRPAAAAAAKVFKERWEGINSKCQISKARPKIEGQKQGARVAVSVSLLTLKTLHKSDKSLQ